MLKFLTLFLISFSVGATDRIVTLCVEDVEIYPYLTETQVLKESKPGFLVEIIQKLFKENDIELKIIRRPWKRCLSELEKGYVDASAAVIWSSDRDSKYAFPKKNGRLNTSLHLWKPSYLLWTKESSKVTFKNGEIKNT